MQNRCEVTRTQSKQHYFGNCLEYLPLQLLCNLNTLLYYYNSGQHAITCRCSTSTAGTSLHSIWISTQCDGLVSLSGTEIWKKDKLKHWTICRTNLLLCDLKHILALKKIIKGSMNENLTTRKNLISLKKTTFFNPYYSWLLQFKWCNKWQHLFQSKSTAGGFTETETLTHKWPTGAKFNREKPWPGWWKTRRDRPAEKLRKQRWEEGRGRKWKTLDITSCIEPH